MEHFAAEEWVDFAREVGANEKQQAMEKHLNSGCEACRAALNFWTDTTRNASQEASYEPPSYILRNVKAMSALYLSLPGGSSSVGLARLIMDSSWHEAAAGVRSAGALPSQLLYKFGTMNIDLRIEQIPASRRISIIGQVLDVSTKRLMIADAQVVPLYERGDAQITTTNEFGEFELECESVSNMYLAVRLDKRMEIWVPLNQS